MVDSLDMHAVVGDGKGFREATATLLEGFASGILTFDRDVVVSVFEASIRVLGGLVSEKREHELMCICTCVCSKPVSAPCLLLS